LPGFFIFSSLVSNIFFYSVDKISKAW